MMWSLSQNKLPWVTTLCGSTGEHVRCVSSASWFLDRVWGEAAWWPRREYPATVRMTPAVKPWSTFLHPCFNPDSSLTWKKNKLQHTRSNHWKAPSDIFPSDLWCSDMVDWVESKGTESVVLRYIQPTFNNLGRIRDLSSWATLWTCMCLFV